jgi:hypothetical protein
VAALYTGDGGWTDGSRLDVERGTAVPCAALATARRGVSGKNREVHGRVKVPDETTCVRMPHSKGTNRVYGTPVTIW